MASDIKLVFHSSTGISYILYFNILRVRCIYSVYYFVFTYPWGWRIIAATCRRVENCACHVVVLCGFACAHEWLQAQ